MSSLRTHSALPQYWDVRLPEIPEKHPDDMTSFDHLARNGNAYRLVQHLGNEESTIVSGERYICAEPGAVVRYPDLLVAFDANPDLYRANNGYIVAFHGKAPDLVLEIASRHTAQIDVEVKPDFYAELGVREYWRFDETGEFHGTCLAGDRLVDGVYQPIDIQEHLGGELRGYSSVLGLDFCWRAGSLDWFDPVADTYIPSQASEQLRADVERLLREEAEARVRRLEAELRRRD